VVTVRTPRTVTVQTILWVSRPKRAANSAQPVCGDDADQRAMGFYVVADLAVLLLSQASGRPVEECLQDMTVVLATGTGPGAS
jgi:hypothetical protein